MDLEARKYEFIQKLIDIDEEVFLKLEAIINRESNDIRRISIKDYNKEIDKAIEEVENGNFYSQKDAKEIAKKW